MLLRVRVPQPHRPGALCEVSLTLGVAGADIVQVVVLERLLAGLAAIPGVQVDGVWKAIGAPVNGGHDAELLAQVAANPADGLATLVDAMPGLLAADWAAAAVVPADWASRSSAPRSLPGVAVEPAVAYASWRAPGPLQLPEITPLRGRPLTGPDGTRYAVAPFGRAGPVRGVAGATVRPRQEHTPLLLSDGSELTGRTATPEDAEGVLGLHERASAASLRSRYLGGSAPSETRLRRLLDPAGGRTLLAVTADGQVVAMANLLAEGDLGEIAVLIEDGWQRRGIGTALVRRLQAWAEKGRFAALVAHTAADNVAMLRTLRRLGAGPAERDGAMVSVTLALPGRVDTPTEAVKR
jgi:RimJ/RimL family protein N-acetyltransferase